MPRSDEQLIAILNAQLTPSEMAQGVAYLCTMRFARGATITFPHTTIAVSWDARLAFIDGDPIANWGHACRYVLLNLETGETQSQEARFPPFQHISGAHWQIAYRAPGIADDILPIPQA